jgi:Raf kinase inhibitor-like YbhB/YbcL family protein
MKLALAALAVALIGAQLVQAQPAVAPAAPAAPARTMPPATPLALPELLAKGTLKVSSPAFKPGETIPIANTGYGPSTFPGLAWTKGPYGTRTYAIVLQDSDPPFPALITILHWTIFNIPLATTSLPTGMTTPPEGALQGANIRGPAGAYAGPHPPAGGPVHHYHFQVFALDTVLDLPQGAKVADLVAAMKGHVLASGELVGTYQGPPKPAS